MSVRLTSDPAEFQATTFPFLETDPVLHTLILSNVAARAAGRYPAESGQGYYVSVHDEGGRVIGAAMRTPNRPVYLGGLRADLAAEVAGVYAEVLPELDGVAGDRTAVRVFGARWAELLGINGTESKGTRLHKLKALTPLSAVGSSRPMSADDVELVAEWVSDGFRAEFATPDRTWAERRLDEGTVWFWEVKGEPVSMAGYHLPIYGVCRVGPVYTPPEHRRHGYAGALTGEITTRILAQSNQPCLYTDLANPTSNKIYAQLRPGRGFHRSHLHRMNLRATTNPADFKAAVFPFLQRDPVLYSSILSNTEDRINGILHDPVPPLYLSIHDDEDLVVGAVFCSAQRGIQLGALPDILVPAIADACAGLAPNPDVIAGTASAARQLAELLAARRGKTVRQIMGVRLHKLGEFTELRAEGTPRRAVAADADLLIVLLAAYGIELGHPLPPAEQDSWVRTRTELGRLWVWEHEGRVVSMVGHQQTLFGSTRVGPVYTPPDERGHGYAGALTAHVTKKLLATGSQVCLNTDLANPTANKIYAAIGYRPVEDFVVYQLDPAVGPGDPD